jgi:hypothetical protein
MRAVWMVGLVALLWGTSVPRVSMRVDFNPDMPDGPNRKLFLNTCTSCHSARYVLMQPPFPQATWRAEVNKMHKVYGCPLEEAQVEPLVDYLTAIRGSKL